MMVHETLNRAAEILEAGKWTQGNLFDAEGGMCLYGAVRMVAHEESNLDLYWEAMKALRALGLTTRWNDEEGRTKQDVVEALRMVAMLHAPAPVLNH